MGKASAKGVLLYKSDLELRKISLSLDFGSETGGFNNFLWHLLTTHSFSFDETFFGYGFTHSIVS